VAAVVQPVTKRLSRMEALLIEMRYEQDVQLRRAAVLQAQLDTLTELVSQRAKHPRARAERGGRPLSISANGTETPSVNHAHAADLRLN
jgi:hypothetical protein